MQKTLVFLSVAVSVGCIASPTEAPHFAKIVAPDDVDLLWRMEYQLVEDDRIGSMIPLDFFVYNDETGLPMDNIEVELTSNWRGAYLIPKTAIKIVPPPEDVSPEECDANVDGQIDEDAPDACSWHWDSSGDQYFEISSEFAGAYKPNYMLAGTNEHGVLRVWLYIDSMPVDTVDPSTGEPSYYDIVVLGSIGHMNDDVIIGEGD